MSKKRNSQKGLYEPFRHENHKRPVTRRDFLSQGFIAGSSVIAGPSLMGLFAHSPEAMAAAADCGVVSQGSTNIPFICFDLAGGANFAGSSVMVGGVGGQEDFISEAGYFKLGLRSDLAPTNANTAATISHELGVAFHTESPFLEGIKNRASTGTLSRVNGSVFCARSNNDTGDNPHNPMYGINKAGANGSLAALIGTSNTDSGGRSRAPNSMLDLSVRPTKVNSSNDARGLVDKGLLGSLLPNNTDQERVMQAIENISGMKINQIPEDQLVKTILECAYSESAKAMLGYNPNSLDYSQDAIISAILTPTPVVYQNQANNVNVAREIQRTNDKLNQSSSVMKLVIDGYAGAGTVSFGGYDYHDGTRLTGDQRDVAAGECIGACLEYAARSTPQKPLMIYVFSDGSVAGRGADADRGGKPGWGGDNSSTAAVWILVYDPLAPGAQNPQDIIGRPSVIKPQVGFFRDDGSIETGAASISNQVDILADAIVANYLALHGKLGQISSVLPNHKLGNAANIDQIIAFEPFVQYRT